MATALKWEGVRKLLCVRLDNMGDVLMTMPAIHALKKTFPGCSLTLLASRASAALGPFLPDVDEVLAYDAPWMKHDDPDPAADDDIVQALRQAQFDAAVIFTVYSQNPLPAALMCRLAGIPRVLAHCRENPYSLLTEWRRETEPEGGIRHEVQRQLDLVAHVGASCSNTGLQFHTRAQDRSSLNAKLAGSGLQNAATWMVAHCGATAPSRRYPVEHFVRVFELLGDRAGPIVLTGDASEREITNSILQACAPGLPLIDMTGKLSFGEFACLLEQTDLLLSNNTGPVHLAAALGTPVVDLYALTNPQHTPWRVPQRVLYHDVACKWCYRSVCPEQHHQCLRGVAPERVCASVLELLAETAEGNHRQLAGVA